MIRRTLWAVAMTAAVLGTGNAASAALIDDFSDTTLTEYTLTKVLDQNAGTSNVSFSSPGGSLLVSSSGTTGAEQVLFLRNDVGLNVGDELQADVAGSFTGWDRDIGIVVGYTATLAGLANGAAGDVRSSYVEVSFRSNNQVVSFARNGGANLTSGQEFAGTNYGGATFNTANPLTLFVKRLTANTFEVGWIQGATRHVLTANNTAFAPYTITDANVPGAVVGFYADVRTDLAASPIGLDNLRIVPVPEPAAAGIVMLAACALAGRWQGRR